MCTINRKRNSFLQSFSLHSPGISCNNPRDRLRVYSKYTLYLDFIKTDNFFFNFILSFEVVMTYKMPGAFEQCDCGGVIPESCILMKYVRWLHIPFSH